MEHSTQAPSFEVSEYMGTWHELLHYPAFFQKNDSYNTTATYTLQKNGTVEVLNSTIDGSGETITARGIAHQLSSKQFRVDFLPSDVEENRDGPNYVIRRVWTDKDGKYVFAVVTDAKAESLWLLSREQFPPRKEYEIVMNTAKAQQQLCTGNRQRVVLGFDDINVSDNAASGLPQPYHSFNFVRGPEGGWTYNTVRLLNVYLPDVPTWYTPGAASPPNVIMSTIESLVITQAVLPTSGNPTFVLRSLSMYNIWLGKPMQVYIEMSKNGTVVATQYASLPYHERLTVNITKAVNVDKVKIGCVIRNAYIDCDFIAYDDFDLCYTPL